MGAINTDDGVRRCSASGGTFHALASGVLARGGIVVAAAMDGDFAVRHRAVSQPADLPPLCGSKYVQSHTGDAFRRVRAALRSGREVLFVGTPCQVAALRRFLGREEPLLLAADFFCHGVPSPALWQRCLDEMLRRIGVGRSDVAAIAFRDKSRGWRRYHTAITTRSGRHIVIPRRDNAYQRAFDENLSLRQTCHNCPARAGRSHSDITMADFWDVARLRPDMDDDGGVSLILANTRRGADVLRSTGLRIFDADIAEATRHNPAYTETHTPPHPRRQEFFASLATAPDASRLIRQMLHLPPLQALHRQLNLHIYLFKQRLLRLKPWK